MGKWLSGEKIDENKCNLLEFHKSLSGLLGVFQKAQEIIVSHGQNRLCRRRRLPCFHKCGVFV